MSVSEEAETESPGELEAKPRRRQSVVVAAAALTVAAAVAALAGPQLFKPAAPVEDAAPIMLRPAALEVPTGKSAIACSGILSVEASGMKSENTPVEITVTSAPLTCKGKGATESGIVGAKFSILKPIKSEAGNCHKFNVEKVVVEVIWATTDETEKKSTITIDSISRDESAGVLPVIGKATVEGEFANASVAALPDLESAAKLKDDIDAQCQPGQEKKIIKATGSFDVVFILP